MTSNPILSLVVPTRNRPQYIVACVRNLLAHPSPDVEVVVQDNSDTMETRAKLQENIADSRLVYHHTAGRLDITANFTIATELARGEYVGFLGDDDGINPELIPATIWAQSEGVDALVGSLVAGYNWPDVRCFLYGRLLSGALTLRPFTGKLSHINAEAEMRRCVREAGLRFGRLPKIYHGVVRRECLDKVHAKAGSYFPGPTPDMAGAVAVANFVQNACHIDYPLFISGTGRSSGGGAGAEKKHKWSLDSVPFLSTEAKKNWSCLVPPFGSGTTLWGEDVVQALRAMGRDDLLQDFNVAFLHARSVVFNADYAKMTIPHFFDAVRTMGRHRNWSSLQFAGYYATTWGSRVASLASNVLLLASLSRTTLIRGLDDIEQAAVALTELLRTRRHRTAKPLPWQTPSPTTEK